MHYREIGNFMNILCEMTSKNLDEIVNNHRDCLPVFLMVTAQSCYVLYNTQEERIVEVNLQMINKDGLAVEIDPIKCLIAGCVAAEPYKSFEMDKNTADTLLACITAMWKHRLSTEGLITTSSDDGLIAADLLS